MARLLTLFILIAFVSLGLAYVGDEPGKVSVEWSRYHIQTSVLFLMAAIALFALLSIALYAVLYVVFTTPGNWINTRLQKRNSLGLSLLTESFAAITAGDIEGAEKKLKKAERYLPDQPLTLMLSAQIARIQGNEKDARMYIERMLSNEATEFVALRSLLETALRSENNAAALGYAEKALKLKPSDSWLIVTLSHLYGKNGRPQDAVKLLEGALRKRHITKTIFKRETANLAFHNAQTLYAQQRFDRAMQELRQAIKKQPDFSEAYALLARIHAEKEEIKNACAVIYNGWKIAPHPSLHEILTHILEKSYNREKFGAVARKIALTHPEHEESRLLSAEIAQWDTL